MEHTIRKTLKVDHGSGWNTEYTLEVTGEINLGERGNYLTPGEAPFVDGDLKVLVKGIEDLRFWNGKSMNRSATVVLPAGVDRLEACRWLLTQLDQDTIDEIKVELVEDWETYHSAFRYSA